MRFRQGKWLQPKLPNVEVEEGGLEGWGACLSPGPVLCLHLSSLPTDASVSGSCDGAESWFQRHCPDSKTTETSTVPSLPGLRSRQSPEPHSPQYRWLVARDTAEDTASPLVGSRVLLKVPVLLRGDASPASGFLGGFNPISPQYYTITHKIGADEGCFWGKWGVLKQKSEIKSYSPLKCESLLFESWGLWSKIATAGLRSQLALGYSGLCYWLMHDLEEVISLLWVAASLSVGWGHRIVMKIKWKSKGKAWEIEPGR